MDHSSVVIVGAGPVGLITALGLAQAGVKVTVLEREPGVVPSPRAVVYQSAVIPGIERLGLLDDAMSIGFKATGLDYFIFRTGERIRMNLDVLDGVVPHPYNFHLGQHQLAEIALDHLQGLPDAAVHFRTEVVEVEHRNDVVTVSAEIDGVPAQFTADWLVGADGATSVVRRQLGLELEGMTWPERFVATNVYYDFGRFGFNDTNMMIDPVYGAMVIRIDKAGLWRVTFSEDAELPEDTVAERIPDYFAKILPGDKKYQLDQFSPYRMHQRAAPTFRRGRVVLAGDAAHITNPTAGMGLTSGLFDAYALSEALAAVVHGQVSEEVLDRYSQLRRAAFLEYASPTSSAIKQLVFHCDDPNRLEQALVGLRAAAADENLARQRMNLSGPLETPSLVNRAV